MKTNETHKTVLLRESIDSLQVKRGDVIVDATLGAGGHTLKLLEKVGKNGKVIAIDIDEKAISDFKENIEKKNRDLVKRLILINDNFRNIKKIVQDLYQQGKIKSDKIDGVLADLGWRIEQVENAEYGMSFRKEAPLKMNFAGKKGKMTAKEVINNWSFQKLENIFRELGGEPEARRIAMAIVEKRKKGIIKTTLELADLVKTVKRQKRLKIHPATKVFQALRIVVNKELSNLQLFLEGSTDILNDERRLVLISFHSLEDRLVKKFFRAKTRGCVCPKEFPVCVCGHKKEFKIIHSKGIKPTQKEVLRNRRARSAILRIIEKQK